MKKKLCILLIGLVPALSVFSESQFMPGSLAEHLTLRRGAGRGTGPYRIRFASDSRRLVGIDARDNRILTWDLYNGEILWRSERFGNLQPAILDAKGSHIVIAPSANEVRVLDTATGATVLHETYPSGHVSDATFNPEGSGLAVCTDSGRSVHFYETGEHWYERAVVPGQFYHAAFGQWGSQIAAEGYYADRERGGWGVHLFSIEDGALLYDGMLDVEYDRYPGLLASSSSPVAHYLLAVRRTGNEGYSLAVWKSDQDRWRHLHDLKGHPDTIHAVESLWWGSYFVSGGADGEVRIWDTQAGTLVQSIDMGSPVVGVAVSSMGDYIAAGTQDGVLTVWYVVGPVTVFEAHASSVYMEQGHAMRYDAFCAFDGDPYTGWVEGRGDSGIGESVRLRLSEEILVDSIVVLNGFQVPGTFDAANRVKTLGLSTEQGSLSLPLRDQMELQRLDLGNPIRFQDIEVKIEDTYPGSLRNDTGLTDVRFYYKGRRINLGIYPDRIPPESSRGTSIYDGQEIYRMHDATGRVTANLKIRLSPDTNTQAVPFTDYQGDGKTHDWMPEGARVRIVGRTVEKQRVGSWDNYWYLIEVPTDEERSTGFRWAFAEFIEVDIRDGP